jgi:hypothetical protein
MASIHFQSAARSWLLIFVSNVASGQTLFCADQRDNWAYRLILDDHLDSNPWEAPKPISISQAETQRRSNADQDYWREWIDEMEYNPRKDFLKVPGWLASARKGDADAVHKLDSYIHHNPNWRRRFEVRRMLSDKQGAAGVAAYYAELFNAMDEPGFGRHLKQEEAMIRSGVAILNTEATDGSLDASFSLYRFFSFLTQSGLPANGDDSPWGKPTEICALYLDLSYKQGGVKKVDIAVQNHVRRLGWANRVGKEVYPHTPLGWKPLHRR